MAKFKFNKGLRANLPSSGYREGEYYQCTDTGELFYATSATELIQVGKGIAMQISSLTDNPASITLDSSARRTYQDCTITSRTSITLSGGNANPGYEHYLLFHNTGSSDCVLTPGSGIVAVPDIKVAAGKYLELSWVYTGNVVVLTASENLG